tara:strand:+ start:196 stop:966 length:771 start_codon:yes stop_codon:yes gene_type:complete
MNLIRYNFFFLLLFFLTSCADYKFENINKKPEKKYFSTKGFALIYKDNLFKEGIINKKIKNNQIYTAHSYLKVNTPIKIINSENNKVIETKIFKKAKYPKIFNIVISEEIANELNLNPENPYVEIVEIKKNKKFIAKKAVTYDEEKHIAEKAPVEEIKMDVITSSVEDNINNAQKTKKVKIYKFEIIVSDFYYFESAMSLKKHLEKETQIKNFSVKKINKNKYRLSIGPFKNFNALKSSYISLNNLGFDELEIENK